MIPSFWTICAIIACILIFSKIGWSELEIWQIILVFVLVYICAPLIVIGTLAYMAISAFKR